MPTTPDQRRNRTTVAPGVERTDIARRIGRDLRRRLLSDGAGGQRIAVGTARELVVPVA
jgi:hypothetical protein